MTKQATLSERIFEKSIEAFLLAVENYNKPTIKYRVEAFAIFICNAWELLLKGHLINTKGEESIYYENSKDQQRTFSLEKCVKEILTNKNDPVRINLEKIIELRNTSTHFITEEYEMLYVSLFQACIFNYSEKLSSFAGINIGDRISLGFLSLTATVNTLDIEALRGKYSSNICDNILRLNTELNTIAGATGTKFAIPIEHRFFFAKKKDEATEVVRIAKEGEHPIAIVKTVSDPNNTHPYTLKKAIKYIQNQLDVRNTKLRCNGKTVSFNKNHCLMLINYFKLKEKPEMCFIDSHDEGRTRYFYSQKGVDLMLGELCKDPENIVTKLKAKKVPGAKEF